jgi:hypothetical protein
LQQQQQQQQQERQDDGVLAQLDPLASSAQSSSEDKNVTSVPTQGRLTRQIVRNRAPFIASRQATHHTCAGEQHRLQISQKFGFRV